MTKYKVSFRVEAVAEVDETAPFGDRESLEHVAENDALALLLPREDVTIDLDTLRTTLAPKDRLKVDRDNPVCREVKSEMASPNTDSVDKRA